MNSPNSLPISTATPLSSAALTRRARWADYGELTKPRLSMMSVITVLAGYLAADPERQPFTLFCLLLGTALAAGGAAALNEWMEREEDARMVRTARRPLPAGHLTPTAALVFGLLLCGAGLGLVALGTTWLPACLTLITVAAYLGLYTPLKKLTVWNTEIGAIPGALPPLIGWSAATGSVSGLGWTLFALLYAWQMAHFSAISWICRDDYRRGGFRLRSLQDPNGQTVGARA